MTDLNTLPESKMLAMAGYPQPGSIEEMEMEHQQEIEAMERRERMEMEEPLSSPESDEAADRLLADHRDCDCGTGGDWGSDDEPSDEVDETNYDPYAGTDVYEYAEFDG
jgi:hypothetical protein